MQRDGFAQHAVPGGASAYHPNSVDGGCPFLADPETAGGYIEVPQEIADAIEPEGMVAPEMPAKTALDLMRRTGRSRLLVVDDAGRLVGLLTLKDLLDTLTLKMRIEGEEA